MNLAIEEIEEAIAQLPKEKLIRFREWYQEFDAQNWDEQIEKDIQSGKLENLAQMALQEHKAGKSTKI